MKLALHHLEVAMERARSAEPAFRAAGDVKAARHCKQEAWDCLEAIQTIKLAIVERKASKKATAQGGEA